MNNFIFHNTNFEGLTIIERKPKVDHRGFLERQYSFESLNKLMKEKPIRQINHTMTQKEGTVRGLHFQYPPYAETKIVSCLKGKVWDVAVDLRCGSSTYLKYHAVVLSEENRLSYLIPEGFAHGFQSLTPNCEMMYLHTAEYEPTAEGALNALDTRLNIKWPAIISVSSSRDLSHDKLTDDFSGIKLT